MLISPLLVSVILQAAKVSPGHTQAEAAAESLIPLARTDIKPEHLQALSVTGTS